MKTPNYLRINKGDYPEESRDIIDKLGGTLNPGIEALFLLANNRISLKDNIACVVKDVTLIVDSGGIPTSATGIALNSLIQTVIGAQVIFAQNQTSSTVFPTAQPFISYVQNSQTFEIKQIAGLPANNQFLIRVVVYGA